MNHPIELVVNADDFGQSAVVNEGILTAHRDGIVTSTSLMVRWPAAEAAALAASHTPALSVGLHLDLGEWRCEAGEWQPVYEVAALDDAASVERELAAQLARFQNLMGRPPTHLDSHQHVHRREPVRSFLYEAGHRLGVPVRHQPPFTYVGDFYGQTDDGVAIPGALSDAHLEGILEGLTSGAWELACHPAAGPSPDSMYSEERRRELAVLTSGQTRRTIERLGIHLRSFA